MRMLRCPECGLVIGNSQDATPEDRIKCSCGTEFILIKRGDRKINYPDEEPRKPRRYTWLK